MRNSSNRTGGSSRPLTFPQCLLDANEMPCTPETRLYLEEQEEALKDMALCGISVQSDSSESEGSSQTLPLTSDCKFAQTPCTALSSSFETIYDKANLENVSPLDTPSTDQLSKTLGDPKTKTLLPAEMCSSFENIYMRTPHRESENLKQEVKNDETDNEGSTNTFYNSQEE